MAKIPLYNQEGKRAGEVEVTMPLEGAPNEAVMHQAVIAYLAGQRAGTAQTLTRSQVAGTGKKPWRQKGTGRARQGSRRAPHWRGGGVVFGPHPRSYAQKLPRNMRDLALRSAFVEAVGSEHVKVFEGFEMQAPSTRAVALALEAAQVRGKVLLVVSEIGENLRKSVRALPGVKLCEPEALNAYFLLRYPEVVMTRGALDRLQERWA